MISRVVGGVATQVPGLAAVRRQTREYGRFERDGVGVAQGSAAHTLPAVGEEQHQVNLVGQFVVEIVQYIEPKLLA